MQWYLDVGTEASGLKQQEEDVSMETEYEYLGLRPWTWDLGKEHYQLRVRNQPLPLLGKNRRNN